MDPKAAAKSTARKAAAERAQQTKRARQEASSAAASITDGGAGLASLAVERELVKVSDYLRKQVELLFIIGSYCNDDSDDMLARILKHKASPNMATSEQVVKFTKIKGSFKVWRQSRYQMVAVMMEHLEPTHFTKDYFEELREKIGGLDARTLFLQKQFCKALHVALDGEVPHDIFPQCAFVEPLLGVVKARYIQQGSRLKDGPFATLDYYKLFEESGERRVACTLQEGLWLKSPTQADDAEIRNADSFCEAALVSPSTFVHVPLREFFGEECDEAKPLFLASDKETWSGLHGVEPWPQDTVDSSTAGSTQTSPRTPRPSPTRSSPSASSSMNMLTRNLQARLGGSGDA